MELKFINVGYGEAILIECPAADYPEGKFVMLIDGGKGMKSSPEEFASSETGRLPLVRFLETEGIGHVDLMVLTHPHEDHVSGLLDAAKRFPPKELWITLPTGLWRGLRTLRTSRGANQSAKLFLAALNDFRELCRLAEESGTLRQLSAGDGGYLPGGLSFEVLGPSAAREEELAERFRALYAERKSARFTEKLAELDASLNNYSLILSLAQNGVKLLLPGDTNRDGFGGIPAEKLAADLYKLGHHGQADGSSEELLRQISPKACVCCASSDRRYQSAAPELMEQVRACGAKLYCSDVPPVDEAIPAHSSLCFCIGEDGALTASYGPVIEAYGSKKEKKKMDEKYDVLVIGPVSLDVNIDYLGNERREVGGAVVASGFAAARSGARTALFTKLNPADADVEARFAGSGAKLFWKESSHTCSIKNQYFTADKERRACTSMGVCDPFRFDELPVIDTAIYHFAGLVFGDFDGALFEEASRHGKVAVDVQCLLRHVEDDKTMAFRDWPEKTKYFPYIDYLKTDAAEAQILTGTDDREEAARILHSWGAKEVVISHNTEVICYDGEQLFRCPIKARNLSGRTGRGDTIFAGYITERAHAGMQEALLYATALVSLKMETPGPFTGTREDVLAYIEEFY